jgi:pyrroloquinoline quinone (PQQ) biosynthesis protein C
MNVNDWRQMAAAHGLNEQDVLREAQRLIEQSATDTGGE